MKLENAIAHLDEYGYVVLKEALSPGQANALRDRSAELAADRKGRQRGTRLPRRAARSGCGTWSTRAAFTRR